MRRKRSPDGGGSSRIGSGGERERLIDAFTKVIAERGFARIDAQEVTREAGLPPEAYDEHFRDLRQCMIIAYDRFCDDLVAEIEDSLQPEAPWPEQVRAGVHAALGFVRESSAIARVFAVEGPMLGTPVIDRYISAIERIVSLLRLGRQRSAGAAALPPLTEAVLVAGAVSLVTACLLAEEEAELPALEGQLAEVLLLPYGGGGETA